MHLRICAGHTAKNLFRAKVGWPACAIVAGCLAATTALAQPAGGLSFERAQTLATDRAPMLAARQASVDAAGELRSSADQLPDPKLLVGIDNIPISGPDRWSLSSDPMTQRNIGWMQDVPNAAKRAARAQVAEARTERERAALDAERLAIQREVAQAWLARHFAERQLALFQALEDENRVLRDTVASRIAGGMAMPTDSTMARQESLMLADRRDGLVRQRAQALASLRRWLGDEAAQPLAGDPPTLVVDAAELHGGIERHADLRTFDPMTRMANADVAELEAMKKGDWNWQVMYSNRASAYGDMVSFQLGFELPLWGDKRQDPQIAAKRKEVERITAEREDLLRRRREEVEMQLADLDELTRMLDRLQGASAPLANERVTLALAAYQSARGDLAAVLGARRERAELGLRAIELEAKQYALRAKLNYLIAEPR